MEPKQQHSWKDLCLCIACHAEFAGCTCLAFFRNTEIQYEELLFMKFMWHEIGLHLLHTPELLQCYSGNLDDFPFSAVRKYCLSSWQCKISWHLIAPNMILLEMPARKSKANLSFSVIVLTLPSPSQARWCFVTALGGWNCFFGFVVNLFPPWKSRMVMSPYIFYQDNGKCWLFHNSGVAYWG